MVFVLKKWSDTCALLRDDPLQMIFAFFESIKYVGHLLPVSVLRMYIGAWFFVQALDKYQGDFLLQPKLAASIGEFLPLSNAPEWYRDMVETFVVPHWQFFAYTLMYFEFLIGISFLLGFLVRPFSLIGMMLAWSYLYTSAPDVGDFYRLQILLFFMMSWLGAGRCLGLDYFFFKRQRGWMW